MKVRFFTAFSFGLALSASPFVSGCAEQGADLTSSLVGSANAEPTPAGISTNAPAENPPPLVAATELATAEDVDANVAVPAPGAVSEKKLPITIKPTPPTVEVIKLAQAGLDEGVLLNFITNTGSMFVLSSDDIIYLNDLGVGGNVVTAMMQHDQGLNATGSNQAAQPTQAVAQAAAPTDVNPPQPEPQPAAQVETAPPPANVSQNYFDDNLSPYGTWVDVEGYGRCWQPTVVVVNRGWQPYCDGGRWIYTDRGWYWYSDYSWGATAFHYGRWFNHARYGWCWWPDTVWAPSWVSFRYSGDYCGWAPLPPLSYYSAGVGFSYYGATVGFGFGFGLSSSCYTFVPWNRFCDSRPWHHRISAHDARRVYNRTTVVNNYVTGNNNTVINSGIPAARYREHTRAELRPITLREGKGVVQPGGRSEMIQADRRTLVVNRPRDPGHVIPPRQVLPSPATGTPAAASPTGKAGGGIVTSPSTGRERGRLVENRNSSQLSGNEPAFGSSKGEPGIAATPVPGPSQPRPGPQPRSTAPSGSVVVIGKRTPNSNDSNPVRPSPTAPITGDSPATPRSNPNVQRSAQNNSISADGAVRSESPASRVTSAPGYSPRPTQAYSAPPTTTTRPIQRGPTPESNRPQNPQRFSAPQAATPPPSYSAPVVIPAPRNTPAPSYTPRPGPGPSANAQWSAPVASAPSYTPRPAPSAPAPAPAPAVSAPRSAPVESRPAPSSNARSESGGRNRP